VLAIVRDDEDPTITHVQCVAGNRLPPGTPGRIVRIEGVMLPGLANAVTRAVWLGDSTKDVETMLVANGERAPSKSSAARERILTILEAEGEQESDGLDARVAKEIQLDARTIRNLRTQLGREGLIKSVPEKLADGTVDKWIVMRTHAARDGSEPDHDPSEPDHDEPADPDHDSAESSDQIWLKNTRSRPRSLETQKSLSGYPDHDSGPGVIWNSGPGERPPDSPPPFDFGMSLDEALLEHEEFRAALADEGISFEEVTE